MLIELWRRLTAERRLMRGLARAKRHIDAGELERADSLCVELLPYVQADLAPDLHLLRGLIAARQRHADAADRALREALALGDSDPTLHIAVADAYRELQDARNESACLARALELLPGDDSRRIDLMLRLAGALLNRGESSEAARWYGRVLEGTPDNPEALLQFAALRAASDTDDARAYMDRYIVLRNSATGRLRRALMLPSVLQSEDEIERVRQRLERDLDEVIDGRWTEVRHPEYEIGSTAFELAYHGRNDRDLMRKIARACRAVYRAGTEPPPARRPTGDRVRVGFVSMHFRGHSIARTHSGFISGLPREQFEVHVFALGARDDDWARAIRSSAEHYVALPVDLDRAREAIASAALDLLFYTDIGMDPFTYFLAYWRLAPIQAVSWGHPVTTGIDTIDYFVSAADLEAPGSEDQYSEALIRLPGYFMPGYQRPRVDSPATAHAQLGVPADARLYCCLQNLFKLHPQFDDAMRDILEGDPRAVIVLLESSTWVHQLRRRLDRSLGALAARVRFIPRMTTQDFQRFVAAADVVLDPFHFGGSNSSCEALSFGVPIVTLPAFQLRGRFTMGLYGELGLHDCVARSPGEYAAIALRIGREPQFREELSGRIAARSERLFDRPEGGRALADAFARLARAAG